MVRIRLRRVGAKKQPSYRVVVADSRSPRDGRFIETIGHYNPRTDPPTVVIHEDRALYWLSVGAQPTDSVARFFDQLGLAAKLKQVQSGAAIETVAAPAPGGAKKGRKAKGSEVADVLETPPVADTAAGVTEAPVGEAVSATEPETETPVAPAEAKSPVAAAEPEAAVAELVAETEPAAATPTPSESEEVTAGAEPGVADLLSLGLSARVQSALEAAGIETVAALADKVAAGDEGLLALPGIGAKAVDEIHQKLAAHSEAG